MSNIVEADYTIVQDRTLPVIISEIRIIEQNVAKTALEGAVQIGIRLQEAKQQVGHGNFGQWCQENLNYSQKTADRFMKLSQEYGSENNQIPNWTMLSNLSISKALSLLKVPEEDREGFIEEHDVEGMTVKDMEDEIKRLNEEKESRTRTINELNQSVINQSEKVLQREHEIEDLKRQLQDAEKNAVDSAEIDILKEKLEKEKRRAEEAHEKLKKEKAARQTEIDAAIEKKQGELQKEAEIRAGKVIQKAEAERKNLKEENEKLQRKLENAGNETTVRFKILVDQMQDSFNQAYKCIVEEMDGELSQKMVTVLQKVTDNMKEVL